VSAKEELPTIVLITMDRETSSTVVTRSDGKEARLPLDPSPFPHTSALSSLHCTPTLGGLLAVTRAGDNVVFELPKEDSSQQLAGRLIVYLDQNQWSTIAKTRHDPSRVNDEDSQAAHQLAELVQQQRIVLPASAGHYYETTKWADTKARYSLGLTVLQLSRGWQMRHPIQVRRNELHDLFRRKLGQAKDMRDAPVFTLHPNVIEGPQHGGDPHNFSANLPTDAAFAHEALTSATALIDLMLDTERVEPGPEPGWAAANQRFSDCLDDAVRDSQQKRKAIDAFFLLDLVSEIEEEAHAAGMPLEQLGTWFLKHAGEDIRKLPATGLFREMLHDRHLNRGTVWKTNDLTDMVFLSCAAGYADFVVAENHMVSVLNQGIKRLGRRQNVFRRLRDAVPAIEDALASSPP
jgi:hypothetical protein